MKPNRNSKRVAITVPGDLAARIGRWRNRMNISATCARAIEAEIDMLEEHLGDEEAGVFLPAKSPTGNGATGRG